MSIFETDFFMIGADSGDTPNNPYFNKIIRIFRVLIA